MTSTQWELADLHMHLQLAFDLELWTIPYYVTAMCSIRDEQHRCRRMLQAVVEQELVHVQLMANIANALGLAPELRPPDYDRSTIPHIDFDLDVPSPTWIYRPHSPHLGPLDLERINTMCLVEYPQWKSREWPRPTEDLTDYMSMAEFHDSLWLGIQTLASRIRGDHRQIELLDGMVIESDVAGLAEIERMLEAIRSFGEAAPSRHTAMASGHFATFNEFRDLSELPATYGGRPIAEPGSPGELAQRRSVEAFTVFLTALDELEPEAIERTLGDLIQRAKACWQSGVIPKFS